MVNISGGNVTATGGEYGAGIDSGNIVTDGEVNISSGTVKAYGGEYGAGIGGGSSSDMGPITISGGSITAKGGISSDSMGAAGIGGGDNAAVQSVTITGGTVNAYGGNGAAGIGGGSNTSYSIFFMGDTDGEVRYAAPIAISGAGTVVNAYGGTGTGASGIYGGAGIGSGYPTANDARSVAFAVSITDGATVNTHGGYRSQAIGYGVRDFGCRSRALGCVEQ